MPMASSTISPGMFWMAQWIGVKMKQGKPIDVDLVRSLFDYDAATGVLRWAVKRGQAKRGDVISCTANNGYLVVRFSKSLWLAHRLIVAMKTGLSSFDVVDHINGNKQDNRMENLRVVDNASNVQNVRRAQKNSSCGQLGVVRHGDRWRARIGANGACRHIGVFDTPEQAHMAYIAEKRLLHAGNTL